MPIGEWYESEGIAQIPTSRFDEIIHEGKVPKSESVPSFYSDDSYSLIHPRL